MGNPLLPTRVAWFSLGVAQTEVADLSDDQLIGIGDQEPDEGLVMIASFLIGPMVLVVLAMVVRWLFF